MEVTRLTKGVDNDKGKKDKKKKRQKEEVIIVFYDYHRHCLLGGEGEKCKIIYKERIKID